MIEGLYKPFKHWTEKNAVWLISDTHFGEQDLMTAFPKRPHPDELVKIINQKVGKNGTLIHLGDVGDCEWAKRLKGYKILIKGNHEAGLSNYDEVFDEVYEGPLIISPRIILSHEPLNISWMYNIHGHSHAGPHYTYGHCNICMDAANYEILNLNQFIKSGKLKECQDIHRQIINDATKRARKRGHKLGE